MGTDSKVNHSEEFLNKSSQRIDQILLGAGDLIWIDINGAFAEWRYKEAWNHTPKEVNLNLNQILPVSLLLT